MEITEAKDGKSFSAIKSKKVNGSSIKILNFVSTLILFGASAMISSNIHYANAFSTHTTPFYPTQHVLNRNSFRGEEMTKTKEKVSCEMPFSSFLAIRGGETSSTELSMLSTASASLLAGSIAGAVGVGVAFPLDTLKTKSQVLGRQAKLSSDGKTAAVDIEKLNIFEIVKIIWNAEGISGFYGGVRGMMIGQAIIKSMAFSVNSSALFYLDQTSLSSFITLIIAACLSGFVTSFFVAPIERIKVMLQASGNSLYTNEFDCIRAVLETEGWPGLLGRGLAPTIVREVPSYAIYFVVYGVLMQTPVAQTLGAAAPLIFGAMAGCACWIPVYPIDVVKTLVQNTEGGSKDQAANVLQVTKQIYQDGGIGAFFDGLTPKMLRAAVNHSVTFWVYDLVISRITG